MNIWLTTDTHFNHRKLETFDPGRPANFERLISKPLYNLPYGDVLIHLGDICIGQDTKMHNTYILPIQAKKILIRGNHDRKSYEWYTAHGWDAVADGLRLEMFGKKILLSHMPQKNDGWYDINIHGHFHNALADGIFRHEPEFREILNEKHKLLALEYVNYQPVTLENFVKETRYKPTSDLTPLQFIKHPKRT